MAKLPDKKKPRVDEQSSAVDTVITAAENAVNSEEEAVFEVPSVSDEDSTFGENPETAPPSEDEDVVISAPKEIKTKETNVKVAVMADHSCHIGGVPYHFKKGVPVYVPRPVKEILKNAGLLLPL